MEFPVDDLVLNKIFQKYTSLLYSILVPKFMFKAGFISEIHNVSKFRSYTLFFAKNQELSPSELLNPEGSEQLGAYFPSVKLL